MDTSASLTSAPRPPRWLGALYALSALAAIAAASDWLPGAWLWVLKPLTTALLIVHLARHEGADRALRGWVLTGLVFSLAGDTALLWREGFTVGLVCFLVAHLAYIVAFTRHVRLLARWEPFVFYGLVAAGVLTHLWAGVPGPLRVAVMAYVMCLVAMAAQAATWAWVARPTPALRPAAWAAVGGALFVASDSLLAIDRFTHPLPWRDVWVLGTYWAAQWCIAQSALRHSMRQP